MNKPLASLVALIAAFVLFAAFNILAGAGLTSARIDLTENNLYTLSAGSRAIASKPGESIRLTLYYSELQSRDVPPQFSAYATRVREVLAEYARASRGRVTVEIINPEPFSASEDRAVAAGLVGIPTGRSGEERFYFGLVGTNSTDGQEIIPFFRPEREEFLEYELTRMIYLLGDPEKKTVGLMTWLPLEGGLNPMDPRGGGTPAWQVLTQVKELFEVTTVANDATSIPANIKVLMIVHPKNVTDPTLYAIDQFVLRGGRVAVFVDPHSELDMPPGMNPMQAMGMPRNSDLDRLFAAWGVELVDGVFAADRDAAIRVSVGGQNQPEAADYVAWITMRAENVNADDPVAGEVQSLNFAVAGVLKAKEGATTKLEPLVSTGTDSMAMPVAGVQFMPDPKKLITEFVSSGEKQVIAARVTGPAGSAFEAPPEGGVGEHLAASTEPINIIVIADCDMLADRFWIQEQRLGNIMLGYSKFADNGDLVIGALDNLSGSSDLIGVRARGRFSRPFDRVKEIQKQADQKYLAKQNELQQKLQEAEAKINELQRQRSDDQAQSGAILLTAEQRAEIEKFRAEQVQTRAQLREVRHQMGKDIERLGATLRFVNIGLVPLLVGAGAVGLGFWRAARRRHDRWAPTARN